MTDENELDVVAETPRLVIRPWRPEETARLFDILRRVEVVRWLGTLNPMTDPDQARDRIQRAATEHAADPRFGWWAAVERRSGIPAGTVMLKPLPDGNGEVEIGWHLHPDSWGKGLATEAAGAVLARGRRDGLDEIWAVTHLDNERSAAVCRRIGMRLLGVTHRWYHQPSLMFWAAGRADRPSLAPDGPVGPP